MRIHTEVLLTDKTRDGVRERARQTGLSHKERVSKYQISIKNKRQAAVRYDIALSLRIGEGGSASAIVGRADVGEP